MTPRPRLVTVVAVGIWISGVVKILAAILAFAGLGVAASLRDLMAVIALIGLTLGIVVIVLSAALLRGSRPARVAVTVILGFSILDGVFAAVDATGRGATSPLVVEILAGVLSLAGVIVLWSPPSSRFFRRVGRS